MSGEIRGVLTTLNNALPAGLDGTRIAQWRLRDGVSYAEVRSQIGAALDDFNSEIVATYGDLITVNDVDYYEYANGGTVAPLEQGSSGSRGSTEVAPIIGHSVDLAWWERSLAGDWRFFRDARRSVIIAQLRYITQAFRDNWERLVLTRLTNTTENLLGANGWDVPMANANPNKNVAGGLDYIPMSWGGKTFVDTHNHYLGFDSGSKTFTDVFSDLAATVSEHGHNGPFTAYVSTADTNTIRALANYVKPVNPIITNIDVGGRTGEPVFYMDGQILGTPALGGRFIGAVDTGFGFCGVYTTNRLPTGYVTLYKSYGQLDPRNPISIRIHESFGFGARIMEVPDITTTYPIKEINIQSEYGVGCGINRTTGATGFLVSGGTFVNPTIA